MKKGLTEMRTILKTPILILAVLGLLSPIHSYAKSRKVVMGKPVYCDTSVARTVLNNGSYSQLYCRYSAIMNYQSLHGCCSWAGGVLAVRNGDVICKNGTLSAICSLQNHEDNAHKTSDGSVNFDDPQ